MTDVSINKELEKILDYLRGKRSFDFSGYRPPMLERRVGKRLRPKKCDGFPEYLKYLIKHTEELDELVDVQTINVSRFFRNTLAFDYIADKILPAIVSEKKGSPDHSLRVWSAGCATGEGSTFHVYLPRTDEAEEIAEAKTEEPIPTGSERILFVDDEPMLLEMVEQILGQLGYEVVTANGSFEAMELFRKDPDRFDLVITDMTMPKMTGIELARELLNTRPNIPIILCSGSIDQGLKGKARAAGIREFLAKPISMGSIAETVRKALD